MTLDHFLPRVYGGEDVRDNLVYCCHACNEFKGDYWEVDPNLRLLHPLLDDLTLHYPKQGDGILLALTECGANHLLTLMLNRPELIAFRLEQNEIALLRPLDRALRQKLQDAQKTTYQLETELERMERNVDDNDWRQRRCELMY